MSQTQSDLSQRPHMREVQQLIKSQGPGLGVEDDQDPDTQKNASVQWNLAQE